VTEDVRRNYCGIYAELCDTNGNGHPTHRGMHTWRNDAAVVNAVNLFIDTRILLPAECSYWPARVGRAYKCKLHRRQLGLISSSETNGRTDGRTALDRNAFTVDRTQNVLTMHPVCVRIYMLLLLYNKILQLLRFVRPTAPGQNVQARQSPSVFPRGRLSTLSSWRRYKSSSCAAQ